MRTEYKDEQVFCDFKSDTDQYTLKQMIGKKVSKIEARKDNCKIIFSDGSFVEFSQSYVDYLGIDYTPVSDKKEK